MQIALSVLSFVCFALIIWLVFLQIQLQKLSKHYDTLLAGADVRDLKSVWTHHLERIEKLYKATSAISDAQVGLSKKMKSVIQHIGFIRYNSFGDVGGDQSFALTLLDDLGNGVVVDSIHSRSGTRVYAKSIEKGVSQYKLSDEEGKAIAQALTSIPSRT